MERTISHTIRLRLCAGIETSQLKDKIQAMALQVTGHIN